MRSRVLIASILIATCGYSGTSVAATPPMVVLPASGIRFIAEQNGQFEQTIKQHVAAALSKHTDVQRAYLVSALYPNASTAVVLGIVCNDSPSQAVLADLRSVFAEIAPSNLSLDILFLNPAQQQQITVVAKPFYVRP